MKYYKFILYVSISFYSINSISDDLNQYKIELLIYKYKNVSTDESFNTNLSIPEQNIIEFYDPDLYVNKKALLNFDNTSSFFSNLLKNINPVNRTNNIEIITDKKDKLENPKYWFRKSNELITLNKIKNEIEKNKELVLLESISWLQGINTSEDSVYLFNQDEVKEFGYFIRFYQKRFLHVDMKSFLGISETNSNTKSTLDYIKSMETKIIDKNTNNQILKKDDLEINLTYPDMNEFININDLDEIERKYNPTKLNIYINEQRRIFNTETYLFDHPYFGVLLNITKV
tara:strand:- start:33151 stop:34011 length:861 start_codon:yes stop_codon:yes gene_type:complete